MDESIFSIRKKTSASGKLNRRRFMQTLGVATAAFGSVPWTLGCDASDPGLPNPSDMQDGSMPRLDLPTLGGAPDSEEGRAIAAFVDTVIPGAHRDSLGAPGGIDVGAPGMFFDPELPAAPFVGLLTLVLNANSRTQFGQPAFEYLRPEEREQVVERALEEIPIFAFAVQLAKLAFFSTEQAGSHLGYPGANRGYLEDVDLSFGRAMAAEMTTDGNLD